MQPQAIIHSSVSMGQTLLVSLPAVKIWRLDLEVLVVHPQGGSSETVVRKGTECLALSGIMV